MLEIIQCFFRNRQDLKALNMDHIIIREKSSQLIHLFSEMFEFLFLIRLIENIITTNISIHKNDYVPMQEYYSPIPKFIVLVDIQITPMYVSYKFFFIKKNMLLSYNYDFSCLIPKISLVNSNVYKNIVVVCKRLLL